MNQAFSDDQGGYHQRDYEWSDQMFAHTPAALAMSTYYSTGIYKTPHHFFIFKIIYTYLILIIIIINEIESFFNNLARILFFLFSSFSLHRASQQFNTNKKIKNKIKIC